ncbi:ATP-dependent DNA helicase RecG [Anaerocaecibacter muris]|uniref:ATP-dependent DNA helicase RecG n=1 Tax=Anaerocaecibacter muris TaxID=2941513 RepID=UPI00203E5938|nr:ATP-dependent DNA helicase RecG [Anaerocaecibacter muris]
MELSEIKGIGAKRLQALNEMGIYTPSDLLLRFPDKYVFCDTAIDGRVRDGEEISFVGDVVSPAKRSFIRRGLNVVNCTVQNNGVLVRCSWFNQPFAARNLQLGSRVYVVGKVKKFKNSVQLTNPTLLTPQDGDDGVIPVYKTTIPSRTFAAAVKTALDNVKVNSYIPSRLAERYGLIPLQKALQGVHAPRNRAELADCKRSVAVENLCYVITSYRLLKDDRRDFVYSAPPSVINDFIKGLPYSLTAEQVAAAREIISALRSDKLANMLVQGEVGCGKTVVAMLAMFYAAKCGCQSAIMTPTEVLARQHYATMVKILEPLGVKTQLLCASMNARQKEEAMFNIKYGNASCIVGTQSLIGDCIEYKNLRLVIVDEQQRFGVNQRAKLESKGNKTDMIVMTATPIPRTLALSLYGELQQTEIRELPANRPKIHTSVVPSVKIGDMYDYIGKKAAADERTYIICPRIDGGDDDVTGVDDIYKRLKNSALAPLVGCVHGKMKDAEKNEVMSAFKSGAIKILVSTTVVEVGIDVPEATTVVVYDAERFGLAQLHQIRGRVGRGVKESYCFLISENGTPESDARLKDFCGLKDGFSVSELDFNLRGAGDFVGLRQHGSGTLQIDNAIIERARALSDALIADGTSSESIIGSLKAPEFIRSVTMN